MATAKKIIEVAAKELGTKESPANSNNVKYNTEYYGRNVYGDATYPWCMVFVWWVFKHADASSLFYDGKKTASCPTFSYWAMNKNKWVTSGFKPGDVIIFRFSSGGYDHTGILERVNSDGSYTTIEGNTSLTSNDNGGCVMRRTRYKSQIIGAYRPPYDAESSTGTIGNVVNNNTEGFDVATLKTLSQGSSYKAQVKAMQLLLAGNGYSLGSYGADGIFGSLTVSALKKYQKAKGITVDGICGPQTWGKLLGV